MPHYVARFIKSLASPRFFIAASVVAFVGHGRAIAASDSLAGNRWRELPVTAAADFRNFSMPLRDMGAWFTHPGLQLGTEIFWNRSHTLVQQAAAGYGLNSAMGNSILAYTQLGYRRNIYRGLALQGALGLGWQRTASPSATWVFRNDKWERAHGGKSMVMLPVSLSLSYRHTPYSRLEPFISLSTIPVLFYNRALPLSLANSLLFGVKVHHKSKAR